MTNGNAVTGSRRKVGAARTLYLVDLENVVGHGQMTAVEAEWAWADLTAQLSIRPGDLAVVATGRGSAVQAAFAVRPHRLRIGHGIDGADLQLLQVLDTEPIAARYDRVVLVSGDAIFTEAIARLGAWGVEVVVAAHASRLAARLRLAAHDVVLLADGLDLAA